jgi:hypothetical protein
MEDQVVISIVVAALVLFVTFFVYWMRRRATQANTVLLVGLTDSGKTLIFSQLITGQSQLPTSFFHFVSPASIWLAAKNDDSLMIQLYPP